MERPSKSYSSWNSTPDTHYRWTVALANASGARTLTISDQEFAGGGRYNSGRQVPGARDGIARETVSTWGPRTSPARALTLWAMKVESIVEITFDSPANAGGAGWRGVERPEESLGTFSAYACDIAKPSTTRNNRPNAKLAHLRTMDRSYTLPSARAMRSATCRETRNSSNRPYVRDQPLSHATRSLAADPGLVLPLTVISTSRPSLKRRRIRRSIEKPDSLPCLSAETLG